MASSSAITTRVGTAWLLGCQRVSAMRRSSSSSWAARGASSASTSARWRRHGIGVALGLAVLVLGERRLRHRARMQQYESLPGAPPAGIAGLDRRLAGRADPVPSGVVPLRTMRFFAPLHWGGSTVDCLFPVAPRQARAAQERTQRAKPSRHTHTSQCVRSYQTCQRAGHRDALSHAQHSVSLREDPRRAAANDTEHDHLAERGLAVTGGGPAPMRLPRRSHRDRST